jgi:hypothetical protein
MSKQKFCVVEVGIKPLGVQTRKPIKANLSKEKANGLRDRLENKQIDFDPDNIISYLAESAN